MRTYPDVFVSFVNYTCQRLHLEQLQQKIYWLIGNPAGFKPNSNLAQFLGSFVLSLISVWNHVTSALTQARELIVFLVAGVGVFGLSVQAAFLHDLLFLCSFWLLWVYSLFAAVYWYILSMLSTLMKLFRGRKFNTIRGRDDSNSFNVTEMYIGVLIVTISIFLLPTFASFYYYAFISIILSVMVIQLLLILMQILLTDFPYFLLIWTIWHPYTLPNRIRVEVCQNNQQLRIVAIKSNISSCFVQLK